MRVLLAPIELGFTLMERRKALGLLAATGTAASLAGVSGFGAEPARAATAPGRGQATTKGGYTFALGRSVKRTSVQFSNRTSVRLIRSPRLTPTLPSPHRGTAWVTIPLRVGTPC
ncbi:hypothetical protein JCM9533A_62640 [Catenuloplanes niger JCM 9533]